jgi:HAD superfamily hydrolase (TIGR01509 family)
MINWTTIDTVLLDMDGTLLDLHFDNYFWLEHLPQRYAQHHGCDPKAAKALLIELSNKLQGSLDWYCIDYWSEATGMDITALKREVSHLIRLRPDTAAFLRFLQKAGKQATLVTNAHPKALALKLEASGLHEHINTRISAHQFKLAKENVGFWAKLQEHSNLDYSRCLFIDDNLQVLRRAQAEGVANTLQILHPDSSQAPNPLSEFRGITDFREVMSP